MTKTYVLLSLLTGVFMVVQPLFAATLFHKTIVLTNHFKLVIVELGNDSLTLTLFQSKHAKKNILVENASTNASLIQKEKVCNSGESIYFITAYDRDSTYGAQTSIIVWQSGSVWKMVKAPFARGSLKDTGRLGIYEIIDDYPKKKTYCFHDGKLDQQ